MPTGNRLDDARRVVDNLEAILGGGRKHSPSMGMGWTGGCGVEATARATGARVRPFPCRGGGEAFSGPGEGRL